MKKKLEIHRKQFNGTMQLYDGCYCDNYRCYCSCGSVPSSDWLNVVNLDEAYHFSGLHSAVRKYG
ncbi:hypothetical protein NXH76_21665 [Blautia schinkii]|nr:hypothetical protein [Blautia schinkii]